MLKGAAPSLSSSSTTTTLRFFGNRTPFPGAPSRQDFLYAWQRAHEEAWDVSVYHRHATSDPLQFAQGML